MRVPCTCKRFKCFDAISKQQQTETLRNFNALTSYDEQNLYLAGLITMVPIKQRRPRQNKALAQLRDVTFVYRIRITDGTESKPDIPVCAKAFCAMHGISKNKISYLQKSLN